MNPKSTSQSVASRSGLGTRRLLTLRVLILNFVICSASLEFAPLRHCGQEITCLADYGGWVFEEHLLCGAQIDLKVDRIQNKQRLIRRSLSCKMRYPRHTSVPRFAITRGLRYLLKRASQKRSDLCQSIEILAKQKVTNLIQTIYCIPENQREDIQGYGQRRHYDNTRIRSSSRERAYGRQGRAQLEVGRACPMFFVGLHQIIH